jgi:hypothetical protein
MLRRAPEWALTHDHEQTELRTIILTDQALIERPEFTPSFGLMAFFDCSISARSVRATM